MNKMIHFLLVLSLSALFLSGCHLPFGGAEATLPPSITRPEGGIISTNPKIVEGRIKKISGDKVTLTVDGVDWNMELSDAAEAMVTTLNKAGVEVQKGTFVMAYYEEDDDGEREVTRIEVVQSN